MNARATFAGLPLAGRHVVVTRPEAQAAGLAQAIAERGGMPKIFPLLTIGDVADPQPILEVADRLDRYDVAVFVSANAIEKALPLVLARRPWPASLKAAVMGKTSENTLRRFGIENVLAPKERFDSEALLALADFQDVAGKAVIVFRGDAGRELLGGTLEARGATVEYLTCYRRTRPDTDARPLLALWQKSELDALALSSSEGLRNLWAMLNEAGRAYLIQTPVFVPHERIAEEAARHGLERIILTAAGDVGLLAGLTKYFA